MIWYEFLLILAFLVSVIFTFFRLIKEERQRTAAIVKRELVQRQFYEHFLNFLPMWELYLQDHVNHAPAQAHLTDLMIKSMEDMENV